MIKLQTPVEIPESSIKIGFSDAIILLGSCFSDNIGSIMKDMGFDVMTNPFGTLYNPVSVCNSIRRLDSAVPFSEDECVQMGAGSQLFCSATTLLPQEVRRRSFWLRSMLPFRMPMHFSGGRLP